MAWQILYLGFLLCLVFYRKENTMNDSIYRISLDMHECIVQKSLKVKKNDNARVLKISLVDNGKIFEIAEGCVATFRAKKPDGTVLFNNCTIENNVITYELTNQTSAVVGEVECEVTLYDSDNKQITSPRFSLVVTDTLYSDDEIESQDEFNQIAYTLTEANVIKGEVEPNYIIGRKTGSRCSLRILQVTMQMPLPHQLQMQKNLKTMLLHQN